jgi:hypothetical protein
VKAVENIKRQGIIKDAIPKKPTCHAICAETLRSKFLDILAKLKLERDHLVLSAIILAPMALNSLYSIYPGLLFQSLIGK